MARDREGDALGTSQSKRPALKHLDSSSSQVSYRTKGQKHVVGGGTRLHARVPSSKGLHKHHVSASTTKLNRRQGSPSPDRSTETPLASLHRRAASDQISGDSSFTDLKKNASQTSLKRNRSQVEVGKKTKSTTNLKRSSSNPAVHKLRAAGFKVHFNLGDDEVDDDDDGQGDGQEDEWVDASTSASPLLSRRSSAAATGQDNSPSVTADNPRPLSPSPSSHHEQAHTAAPAPAEIAHSISRSISRDITDHKQYLTSRILQRTPSQSAPPKMSAENVSVRPGSSQQHSPDSSGSHGASTLSNTPRLANLVRSGSSGGGELTSRFVGNNSQEPGSRMPGGSFLTSAIHGVLPRTANGTAENNAPRRPRSLASFGQMQDRERDGTQRPEGENLTDDEDPDSAGYSSGARRRRSNGHALATPQDMNRTQQKLNLQRASSSLETAHPHPAMGMGLAGVPVAGPLVGGSGYDVSRDPRLGKLLERTGTEYLVVRRYQNPVARSLARVAQLPGVNKNRQIPRSGTAHSKRGSDFGDGRSAPSQQIVRDRDQSVATLMNTQSNGRRPPTPRRAFSSIGMTGTAAYENGEEAARMHERQGLSGASLVDRGEDAETVALLRNLWDKNMDLSASQD
ncbi:hypothetical protein B0T22DRAFT_288013 [Podospora appendiculata]|uniref:TORC1 subunit TCO89 n=1 Tax=Podospora appendiculata TaxID=314037 RepID=A0AAE0X192_9PEZI|nr:hypothetical protein B0T22DRAFT_288013 [Podospora appendiculata]